MFGEEAWAAGGLEVIGFVLNVAQAYLADEASRHIRWGPRSIVRVAE